MKKAFVYIFKSIKWILVGVAGLLLLVLLMLYLPPVQDFAVGKALGMLNSKGDMHIGVKKLRLTFPLDLRIDSLTMATPGMEIAASRADASIEVLPLLKGHVNTGLIGLRDAVVNIGTPDSSLYMRANNRHRTTDSLTRHGRDGHNPRHHSQDRHSVSPG